MCDVSWMEKKRRQLTREERWQPLIWLWWEKEEKNKKRQRRQQAEVWHQYYYCLWLTIMMMMMIKTRSSSLSSSSSHVSARCCPSPFSLPFYYEWGKERSSLSLLQSSRSTKQQRQIISRSHNHLASHLFHLAVIVSLCLETVKSEEADKLCLLLTPLL